MLAKEAAEFWNEPTRDGFPNMRMKINTELEFVERQFKTKQLPWCRDTLESLVAPYEPDESDHVLQRQGDLVGQIETSTWWC